MTTKSHGGSTLLSAVLFFTCLLAGPISTYGQPLPLPPDPNDEARQEASRHQKAQEYYAEGERLLAEGKLHRARTKFKAAIGLVGLEGAGGSAFAALERIHREGMSEVNKAVELAKQEKFVEALELAKETRSKYANIFSGLNVPHNYPNVSTLARKLADAIEKNPLAQSQIQEKEATKKLDRIRSLEQQVKREPTRYYDLYKLYRNVAKRFPLSATGVDCAAEAEKLRADKEIWQMILDERKCRMIESSLQSIEMYEKNGQADKAKEEYAKLTERFGKKSPDEYRKMIDDLRPKANDDD